MPTQATRPRVIVVGAGFAGLQVARGLRKSAAEIILVDRHNYHLFQPLLYQVATAALSPADIAYPIRRIFRKQKNVSVGLAEVEFVDLTNQTVGSQHTRVKFDYLVIAVGATHSYFGNDQWRNVAPGLKSIDDALAIRKRILLAYEEAEYEADDASRRADLTFVVVGGGPTGVELAGALREIAAEEIQKDFRFIDTKTARIVLVQGAERLLPQFPPALGDRAKKDLEAMGVEVRLNCRVTEIDAGGVWVGTERFPAQNVFWAAGVEAPPLLKKLGVPVDKSGRVIVQPDLSAANFPNVFVIGDAAAVIDPDTHQPVPGLAPAAMQMGRFVARIIAAEISGVSTPAQRGAFHYRDKGTLATIGVSRAVADIRGWKFTGLLAWLLWCLVHLSFLISFRSRLFVMMGWIFNYVFHSREARLITGPVDLHIHQVRLPSESSVVGAGAEDSGKGGNSTPA